MKANSRIIMTAALVLVALPVFAHPGGLDGNRCHTDRKTSERHCHKSTAARSFEGMIVRVNDGDSYHVLADGRLVKLRLQGVDCPETRQVYGQTAKATAKAWLIDKNVTVETAGKDRYGRVIGKVFLDGKNVAHMLVVSGTCWRYTRYAKDPVLIDLEADARTARRGLWAYDDPVPPWEFRAK